MTPMLEKLATLVAGDPNDRDTHVHFHRGPQGQPMACHDPGCEMPRLTV